MNTASWLKSQLLRCVTWWPVRTRSSSSCRCRVKHCWHTDEEPLRIFTFGITNLMSRFENWTLCVLSLLRRSGGINQSCCVSESCGELYPPPPVEGLVWYISVHGAYMWHTNMSCHLLSLSGGQPAWGRGVASKEATHWHVGEGRNTQTHTHFHRW